VSVYALVFIYKGWWRENCRLFLQNMSAVRGVSKQQAIADHENLVALYHENNSVPRHAGSVRIVTSAVARNSNITTFLGMSNKDSLEYRQNQRALDNEHNNVQTGGIRILTSVASIPTRSPVVMAIPAGEPGVTISNARRVVLGVCTRKDAPGPHIFMLQHDTVSRNFELPTDAVFLQIQTADVSGYCAASGDNPCDFLGFWTKACMSDLRNTGRCDFMHTTVEYGSPVQGLCSCMVMVIPRELGLSPKVTMNFCSSNHHILNLQNISVVVKSAGGAEQRVTWDGRGIGGSADCNIDQDNIRTTFFLFRHEASNTLVTMQENNNARHLSLSFRLNDEECDQSHVKTSACVWQVWLDVNRAKVCIMEIHVRMEA